MEADLDLTSGSTVATTTNTTCPFFLLLVLFTLLFTIVVSSEDFEKNPELCACFRAVKHRENSETRFCSVFAEPGKGAGETNHKEWWGQESSRQPRFWDWISEKRAK